MVMAILVATLLAATPLLFAALGELVAERSGVINLGVEGMMLIGSVTAFGMAIGGFAPAIAILAAMAAGAMAAGLFALLAIGLAANQYAAGLALTIFGSGLSAFIGHDYGAAAVKPLPPLLFGLDPLTWLSLSGCGAVWWFLYRSKAGLVLRIVGESPESAHALGYPVRRIRLFACLFGGAMAGLAGAYLSLVYTPLWVDNMTAGRGWIALALVVFAAWRPWRLLFGAWLFGGATILQLFAQSSGWTLPSQALSALPYLATIIVLVIISRDPRRLRLHAPNSLGKPFHPES